jgi:hypothetical protein
VLLVFALWSVFPALRAKDAKDGAPKSEGFKPAPNAGFRGPKAQNPAKIGISPIKTQESCGKRVFPH